MSSQPKSRVIVIHKDKEIHSTTDDTGRFNLYHADTIIVDEVEYSPVDKDYREDKNTTYIYVKQK